MKKEILRKYHIIALYTLAVLCLIPAIVDFSMGNRFTYGVLFTILINLASLTSDKK